MLWLRRGRTTRRFLCWQIPPSPKRGWYYGRRQCTDHLCTKVTCLNTCQLNSHINHVETFFRLLSTWWFQATNLLASFLPRSSWSTWPNWVPPRPSAWPDRRPCTRPVRRKRVSSTSPSSVSSTGLMIHTKMFFEIYFKVRVFCLTLRGHLKFSGYHFETTLFQPSFRMTRFILRGSNMIILSSCKTFSIFLRRFPFGRHQV